jgi:glycosyltransferase involved in cell wall biosynthesis
MKVTIVAPYEGRGFLQPHVDKLLPALLAHGYSVEFVGWDRCSRWPRRSSHEGIDYTMILRGGGYSTRRLLLWMPVWYLVASLMLARRGPRSDEVVMALDFEGALPAAAAGWVRGGRFIYNCRDNISMRYRLPRAVRAIVDWLDWRVMTRADSVIFPDECRIPTRRATTNFFVIRNCAPEVAITCRPDPSKLTVYASGNLRTDRGIALLLDAAAEVENCRVLAAGKCRDKNLASRLAGSPGVEYRGVLPPAEALELCGEADVVFTFYAPTVEINRRAVSNKWSDAMMAGRPILINSEVEKSAWIVNEAIGYDCGYEKDALVRVLRHIAANRKESAARGARGRALWEAGYRWDLMEDRIIALVERASLNGSRR